MTHTPTKTTFTYEVAPFDCTQTHALTEHPITARVTEIRITVDHRRQHLSATLRGRTVFADGTLSRPRYRTELRFSDRALRPEEALDSAPPIVLELAAQSISM
ncbi:hypothetical protein [Agromyces sp. Soil535]|uniref:hypothetical protein n=1 Tax=Agromyces sp. Soil535 TaxID=1736390 RepID=UPI0006FE70D7|nr:hypothetical protein [Agromyces sp. Soil535]KRE28259.1 hypothetical protein ASG80_21510 [Agromyces sp. Soil535]